MVECEGDCGHRTDLETPQTFGCPECGRTSAFAPVERSEGDTDNETEQDEDDSDMIRHGEDSDIKPETAESDTEIEEAEEQTDEQTDDVEELTEELAEATDTDVEDIEQEAAEFEIEPPTEAEEVEEVEWGGDGPAPNVDGEEDETPKVVELPEDYTTLQKLAGEFDDIKGNQSKNDLIAGLSEKSGEELWEAANAIEEDEDE